MLPRENAEPAKKFLATWNYFLPHELWDYARLKLWGSELNRLDEVKSFRIKALREVGKKRSDRSRIVR